VVEQIAVVDFDTPTSIGTFDVTSSRITEAFTAAIFLYERSTALGTDSAHGNIGLGACQKDGGGGSDSANENASYQCSDDNANRASPACNTARDTGDASSHCIIITSGTGVLEVNAFFDSSIAGGVRLNFDAVAAVGYKVRAILFAGFASAWVGTISATVQSSETLGGGTVPSFKPDFIFFFGGAATFNTLSQDAVVNLGFAARTSPIQQCSAFINFDTGTEPSDADGELSTDRASCNHQGVTRTQKHIRVDTFDAGGFTWTPMEGTTIGSMYLALKCASSHFRVACAAMAVSGSTGLQSFNAFGFTPDIVFGMTTLLAAQDTYTDGPTAAAAGLFATGRYGSRAITMHGEEGVSNPPSANFNTHNRAEDVALLTYEHTGTIAQRATWAGGSGAGGFTLDFSVATAGNMVALGLQFVPGAVPSSEGEVGAAGHEARRRHRPAAGGVHRASWFGRTLADVSRFRRAAQVRRRSLPPEPEAQAMVGQAIETPPTGKLAGPGMVRGRLAGASIREPE
jgi:hypothetical protein